MKTKKLKKPRKLRKPRRKTTFKEDMAKVLFELGRIAVAGVGISALLRGQESDDMLMVSGFAAGAVCFIASLLFGRREIKKDPPFHKRKRRRR